VVSKKISIKSRKEKTNLWDFKEANTKEYTHCIHTYPAMMIPQVARQLIKLYGKNAYNILDPFMGSGTSLVEASLTSHIKNAYGFDLNPLAVLIANVKTKPLKISDLEKDLKSILINKKHNGIPDFKNIEFWFKKDVITELARLKTAIMKIKNKNRRNFFLVVFSETVRNVSNTRNGEFKLYRISEKNLKTHRVNVFGVFTALTKKYISGMTEYKKARKGTKIKTYLFDTKNTLQLEPNSIHLIVTSPPYGDSRTTVAYGQFSRLALQWLDYNDANTLDKKLLGGIISKNNDVKIDSSSLKFTIKKISKLDSQRAKEILSFYEDFDKCAEQINRVMAKGGYVCFVVGNRTVKGINIPTDKIMIEMFQAKGKYKHITTYLRNIPYKRMPKANSPTNIKGKLSPTMNNEFIFVLRKC